jgi:hypothetical protein
VTAQTITRWGLLWHSRNALDGDRKHFIFENTLPVLFDSRAKARAFASKEYGYIRTRPDLRAEPHGWRMPRALRVKVTMEAESDA